MKNERISFTLSKTWQPGNYEPIRLEVTGSGELEPGESKLKAYKKLKKDCERQIGIYHKELYPKKIKKSKTKRLK